MKQAPFSQAEHQNKKRVTRRERFLARMDTLVPWQRLIEALSPFYFLSAAGRRGRPPIGLERMLRIHFLQQWYALADVTMAEHLVRDDDKRVRADAGSIGMGKRLGEEKDAETSRCCIAAKRGAIKKREDSPMKDLLLAIEKTKASIRAKVEHPFHVIKNLFGYRKVRYKGLAKNIKGLRLLAGPFFCL